MNLENKTGEEEIDLKLLLRALLRRGWLILLVGVLCAVALFAISCFLIPSQYASSVLLYVNNAVEDNGGEDAILDNSDIDASKKLVSTYIVILESEETLLQVIENTGVPYSCRELARMLDARAVNDTEIFKVTVTSTDPTEAALLANEVAVVLAERVEKTIRGTSMQCVNAARVNQEKVAPSNAKNALLGFLIGAFLTAGTVILLAILDGAVHDEEYVLQTYDFPILASVPNLLEDDTKKYAYYKRHDDKAGKAQDQKEGKRT